MLRVQMDDSSRVSGTPYGSYRVGHDRHAESSGPLLRNGKWVLHDLRLRNGEVAVHRAHPIQGLRHGVHLVIVAAVRKGGRFLEEDFDPRCDGWVGKIDLSRLHL